MSNPTIQLKFDQKLDQDLTWDFYSSPEFGGCNFWKERALFHHPKLLEIELVKNPKNFLDRYISTFYNSRFDEMKKHSQKTSVYLNQSQNDFFKIVDKIFTNHPWPRKEFTGFFLFLIFVHAFLIWAVFKFFFTTIVVGNFSLFFMSYFISFSMTLPKKPSLKSSKI